LCSLFRFQTKETANWGGLRLLSNCDHAALT
jgi:hypothetical protein